MVVTARGGPCPRWVVASSLFSPQSFLPELEIPAGLLKVLEVGGARVLADGLYFVDVVKHALDGRGVVKVQTGVSGGCRHLPVGRVGRQGGPVLAGRGTRRG